MEQPRIRIRDLLIVVAAFAATLALVREDGLQWVGILIYMKVGLLLASTFAARYAKSRGTRDWSFGFSAAGWSHAYFATRMVWSHTGRNPSNGLIFYLFDEYAGLGSEVAVRLDPFVNTRGGPRNVAYAEVFGFWITIGVAVLGGYLALALARRRSRSSRPGPRRTSFAARPPEAGDAA